MAKDMFGEGVEILKRSAGEMRSLPPSEAVEFVSAVAIGGLMCVAGVAERIAGVITKEVADFLGKRALDQLEKLQKPFDQQKRW